MTGLDDLPGADDAEDDAVDGRPEPEAPTAKPSRRAGRPMGETIGGILVGFDQQIMRTLPPPHELVQKGSPVRGLSAADGGRVEIGFPDDDATGAEADDAADPAPDPETPSG
jgi:hypothetical protein